MPISRSAHLSAFAGHDARPLACVMGDMDMLRPLALAGIPCAVVAATKDPTRFSRFARAVVERDNAWTEPARQVERLLRFAEAQEASPVLFFADDAEMLLVSRHRDALGAGFRLILADSGLVDTMLDKARFRKLAERLGLPVPASRHLRPGSDALVDVDLGFPLVVKPLTRREDVWGPVAGPAKALRIESAEDLASLWPQLVAADVEVIAQELVEGPESRIESYHAYVDGDGEVAGEFTGAKIRTLPLRFGHSTALRTTDAADVVELGRELMRRLGLRGLMKADFKRAPDGALRLLEVNPRFSLWHHLGAVAGVNLPALVYADLVGLPRPAPARARPDVTWVSPVADLRAARAAGVPFGSWLRSVAGARAVSVLAWDDPMPFLHGKVWTHLRMGRRQVSAGRAGGRR